MARVGAAGDAEVGQHVGGGEHQDVLRLHVAVQDALVVGEREGVGHGDARGDDVRHGERAHGAQTVVQGAAFVVLHDDARTAVRQRAGVEDGDDVRVLAAELDGDGQLAAEADQRGRVGHLEDLDRDVTAQAVLARAVDGALAALGDHAEPAVTR